MKDKQNIPSSTIRVISFIFKEFRPKYMHICVKRIHVVCVMPCAL